MSTGLLLHNLHISWKKNNVSLRKYVKRVLIYGNKNPLQIDTATRDMVKLG